LTVKVAVTGAQRGAGQAGGMDRHTALSSCWRRGHGPWLVILAVLLGLTGCHKDPIEITVPGHDELVHGSYAGHLSSWPNEAGRLGFTAQLEAQWVNKGVYAVTGELITSDGTAHPITARVSAYERWVLVPAPEDTLTPAAPPPIRYFMAGRVPSLSISFCARESSKDRSWSGPAWVSDNEDVDWGRCGDQFSIRLNRVEQPASTRR